MKVRVMHEVPAPTQMQVETYLESKGWLVTNFFNELDTPYWRSPVVSGDQFYIDLSLFFQSDFDINMIRVMEAISGHEKRSELDIYNDIMGIGSERTIWVLSAEFDVTHKNIWEGTKLEDVVAVTDTLEEAEEIMSKWLREYDDDPGFIGYFACEYIIGDPDQDDYSWTRYDVRGEKYSTYVK